LAGAGDERASGMRRTGIVTARTVRGLVG
jgi:hypothetical protein